MHRPHRYTSYLVDIEGVLVRDKGYQPVAGSVPWLRQVLGRGVAVCLVSNNTTHRPAELATVLAEAGFPAADLEIVTALGLGAATLKAARKLRIVWLGLPALADFWREEGFQIVDATREDMPCDAVVIGANPHLQTADIEAVLPRLVAQGADLIALHRSAFYLDETGRRRLGSGAWAAALAGAVTSGRVLTIGKPEEGIYTAALKRVGATPTESLFISDDPMSDLRTARRLGLGTAFVLSGKYPDHRILGQLDQDEWPDLVCALPADIEDEVIR